jgi:tetratricopeptide (TPR) repeat protein
MAQVVFGSAEPIASANPKTEIPEATAAPETRPEPGPKVIVEPQSHLAGQRIGRYKLLEQIGEGGFGEVYMAEQIEPIQRRVALKIIKSGMDSRQIIARFEAERQALALMDHPSIARALDAGTTESGQPYFVMELVRGISITDFCDQRHLTTHERLSLFIKVCHAVQHAHQKGIIHRDIKPSNVLVTLHDTEAVPKVIDFGIAKALGQKLTDKTLFTGFAQFMGTPAYMSPEQAELSGLDIDTRTDIYSLGVLLYELLTGVTPFDKETFAKAALDEVRRIIRETDPPRPSTRLQTLGAKATEVAKHRQTQPENLRKLMRGDLDWVVMKCLEKDRTRRYETANGVATEIERFLKSEPVTARPPSAMYQFQKLVHRHKVFVAAAGAVGLALVLGMVASTFEAIRAKRAEREQSRLRDAAETQAAKSQEVARFLQDMLQGVGPSVALGRDTALLREILDKTAARVGRELTNRPEVEAELRMAIGRVYFELGAYSSAEPMFRQAVALREKLHGPDDVEVAEALDAQGNALTRQLKMALAEPLIQRALSMRRRLRGGESPEAAASESSLALIRYGQGRFAETEALWREVVRIQQNTLGEENAVVAASLNVLADLLRREGKSAEAVQVSQRGLVIQRKVLGNEDPAVARSLVALGKALFDEGQVAQAEATLNESLNLHRKLLGKEHPVLIDCFQWLARAAISQGKPADAEELLRHGIGLSRNAAPGDQHLDLVLWCQIDLARLFLIQERLPEAEAAGLDALATSRQVYGNDHPDVAVALHRLGSIIERGGKIAEAEKMFREALAVGHRLGDQYTVDYATRDLAANLSRQGKVAGLELLYREVTTDAVNRLAWSLATASDPEIRNGTLAVTLAELAAAATGRRDCQTLDTLAAAYAQAGNFASAASAQKEALALSTNKELIGQFSMRLTLYESRKPYQETNQGSENLATMANSLSDLLILQHRYGDAEQLWRGILSPQIADKPLSIGLWAGRSGFYARRGRWTDAATAAARTVELDPTNSLHYQNLAPLLVAGEDAQGYRRLCREIQSRFEKTKEPFDTGRMAKVCLILPDSGVDLKIVGPWAEVAITPQTDSGAVPWISLNRSIAAYRQRQFQTAIESAQKALTPTGWSDDRRYVESYALMAMAYFGLNGVEEARKALETGKEIERTRLPPADSTDSGPGSIEDLIIARALMNEAKGLIEPVSAEKAAPK